LDTGTKLSIEWTAIGRLFCSPANPRRNEEAVPHVAASLRRFGWQQPIVARPSGEVVAGNTRLKAAQSLELTEFPSHGSRAATWTRLARQSEAAHTAKREAIFMKDLPVEAQGR
jgi:hypothetical protein